MNKTQAVIRHLMRRGHITPWTAIDRYGATRLSAIIFNLRKRGFDITTVMKKGKDRNGYPCIYADYYLNREETNRQLSLFDGD